MNKFKIDSSVLTWLGDKVPAFGRLSNEDKIAIFDFSILWSFFEGTKLNGRANVSTLRSFVNKLEKNGKIDSIELHDYVEYLRDRYVRGESHTEKYHLLYLSRSGSPSEVERMLKNKDSSHKINLTAALIIIFRLRNNLFHGEKWSSELQGQFSNFKKAAEMLMKLMNLEST